MYDDILGQRQPIDEKNKEGFLGFCFDTFEESCKDAISGCLCWEYCYEKFSNDNQDQLK